MSVFKYLILTAARLKYNSGGALLLSLLKGTRAHGGRGREGEKEREGRKRERKRERHRRRSAMSDGAMWSDSERWRGEQKETLLFGMTVLLPCTLSDWSWRQR